MKNYYDQKMELASVLFRIATLNEKKAYYFSLTQPRSPKYGEKVSASHVNNEPYLEYTSKIEEIDRELEQLFKEIDILENYLQKMDDSLRQMKGIEAKLFVSKFIDGLDVKSMARKYNYSESHIYRLLNKINKKIKDDKK